MRLKGKVALITGASQGIGAATAKLFGTQGASVAVNYLGNREAAEEVVQTIEKVGGIALAAQGDMEDEATTRALVDRVESCLGPIDVLVLNAAPPASWSLFSELSMKALESKLLSEVRGFFLPARVVSENMIERRSGCIIGLSSGLSRVPQTGFCSHSVAKAAIDGLLRSMALELAPYGIRVNTVAPGLTCTPGSSWVPQEGVEATIAQTPMGRLVSLEEIASAILMLASDEASFVTGAYLPVSGGMLLL